MDNTEEFRCISLCTGYAGIELGLKRVVPALRTVCYVEVEAFACANLVAKMEEGKLDAAPIWTDIKTFDGHPFYKRVHIITAGYPCQPFSVAGQRKGSGDPRHLWPYIERIIQAVRPLWFFGENVSGHLAIGFPEVYRSLRNMGYKVEAGLFTAAEVSAPHKRERLFILAYNINRAGYSTDVAKSREKAQLESCNDGRTSELANSRRAASGNQDGQISGRTRQEDVPQGNGQTGSIRLGTASELGNAEHNGYVTAQDKKRIKEGSGNNKAKQDATSEFERPNKQSGELADTTAQRTQGSEPTRTAKARRQIDQQGDKWPSRPGQPQYEWEEPRVVDDSRKQKSAGLSGNEQQAISEIRETGEGQTQSRLGGAVDGTNCRVDRLRLLGNGVVPQQAEKAFRYLIEKFQ